MSDTALNQIIQYGTQAQRIAFTPNPAAGSQVLYVWYETDLETNAYVWNGTSWVSMMPELGGQVENFLVNGDSALVQRGAGTVDSAAARTFSIDRWAVTNETASVTTSVVTTPNTTAESGLDAVAYGTYTKITNNGKICISQCIQGNVGNMLRGRTVRLQMKLKASTNTTMRIALLQLQAAGTLDTIPGYTTGTGPTGTFISAFNADTTDPTFGANLAKITPVTADNATIANTGLSCSVTTAWQRFGGTFTLPTDYKNLVVVVFSDSDITATASFSISEAILAPGTAFWRWIQPQDQGHVIQLCQRYYAKSFGIAVTPAQAAGVSSAWIGTVSVAGAASNVAGMSIRWPVVLRSGSPLITFYNPNNADAFVRNTTRATNGTATTALNTNGVGTDVSFTGLAAWTIGDIVRVHWTADAEF